MAALHLSLFKRANGIWCVCYEHEGRGRWKSTGSTNKQGALAFLAEFRPEHTRALLSDATNKKPALYQSRLARVSLRTSAHLFQ